MEGIWRPRRHSALRFDGVDDYMDCGNDESLDPANHSYTIEAWFFQYNPPERRETIVRKADSDAISRIHLWTYDGHLSGDLRDASGNAIALQGGTITEAWHHGVFIVNREKQKAYLYLDNIEVDRSDDISGVGSLTTSRPLQIGGLNRPFSGLIASVRIYNRALSEAEIKYLYYNPDDPLDTDHLVLWLHPGSIDTDAGYWWDISGRDNHGQIFGATKVSLVSPEVTVL